MLALLMKKTAMVSGRVSELAAKLLELESKRTGESKAQLLEDALISMYANASAEASKLVVKYASEDPTLGALLAAIRASASKAGEQK